MKIKITFEITKEHSLLNDETVDIKTSLHEALCLAIHEGNEEAMDWLLEHIEDISLS